MIFRAYIFLLSLLACMIGLADNESPAKSQYDFLPDPVATINGAPISRRQAVQFICNGISPEQRRKMTPLQLKSALRELLAREVNRAIVLRLLAKDNLKPSPEMVKTEFMRLLKALPKHRKNHLLAELQKKSMTLKQHIEQLSHNRQQQLEVAMSKWVEKKFAAKLTVSDEEVENYYRLRQVLFTVPEQFEIDRIVIERAPPGRSSAKSLELAETVYSRLCQGESFSRLAREFSSEKQSEKRAAPLPETAFPPVLRTIVTKLQPGDYSNIIALPDCYVIIKLHRRIPPRYLPLDKIKDFIHMQLKNIKIKSLVNSVIRKKRAKLDIEYNF